MFRGLGVAHLQIGLKNDQEIMYFRNAFIEFGMSAVRWLYFNLGSVLCARVMHW